MYAHGCMWPFFLGWLGEHLTSELLGRTTFRHFQHFAMLVEKKASAEKPRPPADTRDFHYEQGSYTREGHRESQDVVHQMYNAEDL